MNISANRVLAFIIITWLLCNNVIAEGVSPHNVAKCTSWDLLLKNDDQSTVFAHLNNKSPYPRHRKVVPPPSECSIIQTIYLGRHGSRHVTKEEKLNKLAKKFDQLTGVHDLNVDSLTQAGFALREKITRLQYYVASHDHAGSITELGRQELGLIARRLATGIKTCPAKLGSKDAIIVNVSDSTRTRQSLDAFMDGLKGWSQNDRLSYSLGMDPEDADSMLRSYRQCDGRNNAYSKTKPQLTQEKKKLTKDSDLDFMVAQTFTKAVLTEEVRLEIMESLYELCQIDSSFLETERLGFCHYFINDLGVPDANLKLLGKLHNQKEWHKRGFASGNTAMYNLALPVLEQLTTTLNKTQSSDDESPLLKLWFTHDSLMIAMIMLMGYLGDKPQYDLWDMDIAVPMSANIQWRVYQCDQRQMVQVLVNELPVYLPDCPDAFCPLSDYIDLSRKKLDSIDFKTACSESKDFLTSANSAYKESGRIPSAPR